MVTAPQPKGPRPGRRRVLRFLRSMRTQLTRQFITRNRRLAFALSAADDRHRGGRGAPVRVVVLARRDDLADPGRRPAAVAAGAAHLLRLRRGGPHLRRDRGQGRGRDRRHHRADRRLRRRAGADQGEARRPGPARRPDAARAAGPHPGAGQAARTRRGMGVVAGTQAGRRLVVRRRLRGVVLRRQDARGGAGRRLRQGHRRGDQGAAAFRRLRRAARFGAQRGVPPRLQRLHAPRRGPARASSPPCTCRSIWPRAST